MAALMVLACQPDPRPERRAPLASPSAEAELARLDGRVPVVLTPAQAWRQKEHMMAFLIAVERLMAALARDDFEEVERVAAVLEPTGERRRGCGRKPQGDERGIELMALDFRCRAMAVGQAARRRDRTAVLNATSNTLSTCNTCHQTYRQEVGGS